MQTLDQIQHQTIKATIKILSSLAEWYALTAAGETLEAGRIQGPERIQRQERAKAMNATASGLEAEATALGKHLELRSKKLNTPAIDRTIKAGDTLFISSVQDLLGR